MKKSNLIFLIASIVNFALISCLFIAMFFVKTAFDTVPSKFSIACGVCFWLFLIIGITLQIVVSIDVRRWYKRSGLSRTRFQKIRPGIFCFFNNLISIISDILMGLSLIAFITAIIIDSSSIFAYISISVLFVSFCAHCTFNGNNYYYIKNYEYIVAQLTKTEEK